MQIEYAVVTLQLPKSLVDYVRKLYGDPEKWLEVFVVNWLRIEIENMTGDELKELFNLEPAFQAVLGQN